MPFVLLRKLNKPSEGHLQSAIDTVGEPHYQGQVLPDKAITPPSASVPRTTTFPSPLGTTDVPSPRPDACSTLDRKPPVAIHSLFPPISSSARSCYCSRWCYSAHPTTCYILLCRRVFRNPVSSRRLATQIVHSVVSVMLHE